MTTLVSNSESETRASGSPKAARRRKTAGDPGPKPGPRQSWAAPAFVLGVGALITAGVALWPAPAESIAKTEGPPAVNVKIQELVPIDQLDEIRLPAVLEPYRRVKVAAEVMGRVEKLGPKEGSDLEPNQPLAWLNSDLIQAAYDQAKAKHELDVHELKRYETLDDRGVATDIELFRAQAAAAISQAVLNEAGERLKRTVIRAPMAGVLNDMIIEPGEFVSAGTPVAEILEIDRLKAVVNLPERDVVHVSVGQKARILVDAIDGYELAGEVTFIESCGDERCRTFRTEITADNKQRRARAGLIVRVALRRNVIEKAIMIPLVAVIPTEEGYQVYVIEEGKARSRTVKVGLIVGDRVQAKIGLEPGDKLIVDGHRLVGDGAPVQVVE